MTSVTRTGTAGTLSASYTYDAANRVATVTYGNGTKALYTYNDAGWVTAIRHEKADQSLILLLGYGYSPDGLITSISESGGPGGWATTTFTYDNRNRLVLESRDGLGLYGFGYTYDQGGNRLTKTDYFNSLLTTYHYDLENPQYYQSKNNRLMYYEVQDITVPESPVLVERVYYQYSIDRTAVGNPDMIVHEAYTSGVPVSYAATDLQYNMQGELWFVTERHWQAGDVWCANQVRDRITEFRGNGRARYMARQRNPYLDEYGGSEWQVLPETAVWSDYDGDTIYGDYVIDPTTGALTNKTAYLPGVGQMDSQTGAVTYYHADHLGTLRATTDGNGDVSGVTIHTAFGEVVCGDSESNPCAPGVPSTSTRFQYAGEWGYESGLGSPGHGGSTGQTALPWQHVGHRWYDPSTGRFLQRDPIGIRGGLNVYTYAHNTPPLLIDPDGLMSPPRIFGPPAPTGPADRAMFDPVWSKVHYAAGVGAGLVDLSFWQTTCLAVKWELWEPDHWPDIFGRFNESYRNQVGDVICAQRGWFDGQRIRPILIEYGKLRRAQKAAQRSVVYYD